MRRKLGGSAPFLGRGSWVRIWHNVACVKAYLPTKWHLDPSSHLPTTDMGRKLGAVPLLGGEPWSPSNTMWPEPRPTPACQVSSWSVDQPFGHNKPTSQTGQDRQTDRQRCDGIGRTVLQKVAQKLGVFCKPTWNSATKFCRYFTCFHLHVVVDSDAVPLCC